MQKFEIGKVYELTYSGGVGYDAWQIKAKYKVLKRTEKTMFIGTGTDYKICYRVKIHTLTNRSFNLEDSEAFEAREYFTRPFVYAIDEVK